MKLLRVALLLFTASFTTLAQTNGPVAVREMSLQDCIQMAVQSNFDVRISRISHLVAGYSLRESYGAYDPVLSASARRNYDRFNGVESESDTLAGGITGLLPWGTRYDLGTAATKNYNDSFRDDLSRPPTGVTVRDTLYDTNGNAVAFSYTTNYHRIFTDRASANAGFASLRQPLLRDFLMDGSRLSIQLRKRDLQRSELELRRVLMDTILQVENAYYSLISARENVKVQEKALELADRLLTENKKRVEVGAMAPLDEKQAQAQVATSRAELISSRQRLATSENLLKDLITDQFTDWHGVEIQPSEPLSAVPEVFSTQDSWLKGMTMRPDLISARVGLEQQDINLRYNRNQLFPQLDLVGSLEFSGSGPDYGSAYRQIGDTSNPSYSYGVVFSIPLSNRGPRERLKIARAQKEQTLLGLKSIEQQILVDIDNDIKIARASYERVQATLEARVYAEAALDAEQKKMESGKSTSFVVLQLQRDLTAARSAEIAALADYNRSLSQLARDEGSTFQRRNITFEVED